VNKKSTADIEAEYLDGLIANAKGEDAQLRAFHKAFEDGVPTPCNAHIVGHKVTVTKFDYDGNPRRGLTATCRRSRGATYVVSAADVMISLATPGGRVVAAYRKWLGIDPFPPGPRGKALRQSAIAALDLDGPLELVVLAVLRNAAHCRQLGTGLPISFRASRLWELVPGEIATVMPSKQWIYGGNPYLSGKIETTRIDPKALGLIPLRLEERGVWDPAAECWGEEGELIEDWAKPIIARGQRPEFEMEQVLPGFEPGDSDPISRSNDLKEIGDYDGANKMLSDACEADLRCLDGHAHLGNSSFEYRPQYAIRHYEVGFRIGELSLGEDFEGVLPWGWLDNRPFLRCMHGYGLCLWRLKKFDEAAKIFDRMLWLNPSDNQGARFCIDKVRAKTIWKPDE
jgi:hypothetical protein